MHDVITSPHDFVPEDVSSSQIFRLTVGLVICIKNKLLLVRSVHSASDDRRHSWMLPQEGYKDEDKILAQTAVRCLEEELGYLAPREAFQDALILGWMLNQLSESRLRERKRTRYKCICFLGVLFPEKFPIHLNTSEIAEFTYVGSFAELKDHMWEVSQHNPAKYERTIDMAVGACTRGFLSWEDFTI